LTATATATTEVIVLSLFDFEKRTAWCPEKMLNGG